MAFDNEEMKRRRELREKQRQQRIAQQKRLRLRLLIAAAVLVVCGVLIFAVSRNRGSQSTVVPSQTGGQAVQTTAPAAQAEETEVPATTAPPTSTVELTFAGDLNVNDAVVNAGGITRDYSSVFMDVLPLLTDADLTVLNFEGNAVGQPYGTETCSAPPELLDELVSAGVDMVQVANSRTITNGMSGLASTLYAIRNAGLEPLGAYTSVSDAKKAGGYTIKEVNGVTIAFVAFTKGMDSMALPEGSERCVNVLYEDYATTYQNVDYDGIRSVLKAAASERPDITIALLHWGSEYNDVVSETQEEIVELMHDEGVDAIIGTHPHYVQAIEYDETAGTFLCYSLGDFISDATRAGTEYSIILDLEITKDNDTGKTRITGYSYTPIYTVAENDTLKVVRLDEAVKAYEENNIDAVNDGTYSSMTYAQTRVEERVSPDAADTTEATDE